MSRLVGPLQCSRGVAFLITLRLAAPLVASPNLLQVVVHWREQQRQLHDDRNEGRVQRILRAHTK